MFVTEKRGVGTLVPAPGIDVPGDSELDLRILRKFVYEVHRVADVFAHH